MDSKSMSSRKQNIFFRNLLALGFDVDQVAKEHKIVLDRNVFTLPNKKAFQVVSHFLFSKLNEITPGKYSLIWPLFDAKDQRLFQKTVFDYLTRIAQESEIRFPQILISVISSFGGEAFIDIYFAFSTHVVQQVNSTFGPMLRRPKYHPQFTRHAIRMQKLVSINSVEKFQALTDVTKFHLETYFRIARKLTDCVERLKLSNSKCQAYLEEQIKAAVKIICTRSNTLEHSLDGLTIRNKEYLNKVEVLWKKLEDFLVREKNLWNCVYSELEDNSKFVLRGRAYSFPLSNNLKNRYEKQYQSEVKEEKNILCIPEFLKLLSLVLESYIEAIKRGKFSETYNLQSLKDTSELDKSLKMLQSFCIRLEKGNIENKKHVSALMEKLNLEEFDKNKSNFIKDLPPSPKKYLQADIDSKNADQLDFFLPLAQDVKFDKNIKELPLTDLSVMQNGSKEDSLVFSPVQICGRNSSSKEFAICGNHSGSDDSCNKTSFKSSLAKDSFSDFPKLDTHLNLLHEETLNSQTLSEDASFSFLD